MPLAPPFLLRCDHRQSQFILQQLGEDWQLSFDTFDKAYEHAEARATTATPLLIYNEFGVIVLEILISPFPPELTKARRHWRDVAALPD